ncbi:MAG: creatininase family protein [Gemmatimonadota bacterium]|nr:creatininase family protein [Gemmatimonadota bacterium]
MRTENTSGRALFLTRKLRLQLLVGAMAFTAILPTDGFAQNRGPNTVAPVKGSVFLEELTWVEIRDAIATGHTTVIVPVGSTEQNGQYLALGKHNFAAAGIAEGIARELGNAIVAPVISIGPGSVGQARGHGRWPGTMAVRSDVFQAYLGDIMDNLRFHGFMNIVVVSEHEGTSAPDRPGASLAAVMAFNNRWSKEGVRAYFIPEYRDQLEEEGHAAPFMKDALGVVERVTDREVPEAGDSYLLDGRNPNGTHEGYYYSAVTMAVDPAAVRAEERIAAGLAATYGVDWQSPEKLAENGRELIAYRAGRVAEVIRERIASGR